MTAPFVHLHVHTQYSLLDGAIRIDPLLERAKQSYEMPAVAITDHGTMFGAVEFYEKATGRASSPSSAANATWRPERASTPHPPGPPELGHLVCWRKTRQGYRNLCRWPASPRLKGFYYKPRIDKQMLLGAC
jgi:DNA polymerase-3 subunit alpha